MSLLEMSLSGGVLAAVIVIIRAVTINRLPKRTFMVLWGVALARLLVPFSLASPFSLYRLVRPKAAPVVQPYAVVPAAPSAVFTAPTLPVVSPPPAEPSIELWPLVWAGGALLLVLLFAFSYGKWHWAFCTSLPVDNEFTRTWLADHPLRRTISVRQSSRIAAPLTYGLLHPVILAPDSIDWADEKTLQYVFAHEYIHIRRFDAAGKLLLAAAVCVHWFNPAVWVMYLLANRDMELSCDEAVVRLFGGKSRLDYVLALLAMEEQKSGLMHLNFSKNAIQERITAIMKIKKLTVTAVLAACLVVAATTVAFATSAPEAKQESTAVSDSWNIHYADGKIWFTVPSDGCSVSFAGRVETDEFGGMSVHYEFPEPEKGETCSYDVSGGGYTELWLNDRDLMGFLPPELKKVDYSIYEPFGLTYDDKLYFKGEKVRYFYDGVEVDQGSAVRLEYLCDSGTVDVYTVWEPKENGDGSYDPFGTLVDVRAYSQEEFDNRVILKDDATIESAAVFTWQTQEVPVRGKSFAEIFEQYLPFGITYVEAQPGSGAGSVYYNGQLVNHFVDLTDTGVFSYQSRTAGGTLNIRTVYDEAGKLTGVEEFTKGGLLVEGAEDYFMWPLSDYDALTQLYTERVHPITGRKIRHTGVDATAPEGTPVLAAAGGTVLTADFDAKYGNYVVIAHEKGLETMYAHLSSCTVAEGQNVAQGQSIGTVGSTGASTGPHLHFEVRLDSIAVDPLSYFPDTQIGF